MKTQRQGGTTDAGIEPRRQGGTQIIYQFPMHLSYI